MKNKTRAFTLIELMVVVSIISVLSSISLVALQSARAKARDIIRLQTLKQVQTALELYRAKYGSYPYRKTTPVISLNDTEEGRSNSCETHEETGLDCSIHGHCADAYGNWDYTMNLLVSEGFLPRIPKDPQNTGYGTNMSKCFKYTSTNIANDAWRTCGSSPDTNEIKINQYGYTILFSTETSDFNLPRYYHNNLGSRPYKYCLLGPAK